MVCVRGRRGGGREFIEKGNPKNYGYNYQIVVLLNRTEQNRTEQNRKSRLQTESCSNKH